MQDGNRFYPPPLRGRGATFNPKGRFEQLEIAPDMPNGEVSEEDAPKLATQVYLDTSKSILSFNDSPDVGFSATLNPYRGCEHGCIYCFARPTHEYLGLSAGLDFESALFAKTDAPKLLRRTLSARSWVPQTIGMSGITDCYQPIERKLGITRQCLEVLEEFRNPVLIVTKNYLITRDIDLLKQLNAYQAVAVFISITTLDKQLARSMEPRASRPDLRLKAVRELSDAGIPVGVLMAPIIPGLTDSEIPAVLKAAANSGAWTAGYTMLRLPYGVKDLFQDWLDVHYPLRKQKILSHIREVRGGKLNSAEYGARMRGEGEYAAHIAQFFSMNKKRFGLTRSIVLSNAAFRRPENQYSLF